MTLQEFQYAIQEGIPASLPAPRPYDPEINHAPKRKDILSREEKKLALRNALRYFKPEHHAVLAPEFAEELEKYGRIYMYRFRPEYEMFARNIQDYPHKSLQAAAIMLMITNNLDKAVAQHPHELITYGGNGAVFQNWAQYRLTMKYLSEMTDEQTLVLYSGHPLGIVPFRGFRMEDQGRGLYERRGRCIGFKTTLGLWYYWSTGYLARRLPRIMATLFRRTRRSLLSIWRPICSYRPSRRLQPELEMGGDYYLERRIRLRDFLDNRITSSLGLLLQGN